MKTIPEEEEIEEEKSGVREWMEDEQHDGPMLRVVKNSLG